MKDEDFLNGVSQQLNIEKDKSETKGYFLARIFYSMAGCWALTSLYDGENHKNTISKEHFDRKISNTLQMLVALFHQNEFSNINNSEYIQRYVKGIYEIYRTTGYFYHFKYGLCPAQYSASVLKNVKFIRGKAVRNEFFVSGLGIYCREPEGSPSPFSPQKQFGLQEIPLCDWFDTLLQNINLVPSGIPEDIEFLRLKMLVGKKDFYDKIDKSGDVSLARTKDKVLYYLYCFRNNHFESYQLPEWQVAETEYRRIAAAILKKCGTLPPIKVQKGSTLAKIHLGYLLPPAEENFFKLYSWPESFNEKSSENTNYARVMSLMVYPAFRDIMTAIGYEIEEE